MNVTNGAQAVSVAKQWLGTPYKWGGGHGGPVPIGTPVDCSGLVNQVYGITGTTYTQESLGTGVSSINAAQPGDLVFYGPLVPNEAYHVGIYVGGGQIIDAPYPGTVVRYDGVGFGGQIAAIRRLVPPTASGSGNGVSDTQSGNVTYTYAQLECVWCQAGGSQQTAAMAAAIAMAESGGNASAAGTNTNGSVDRGLWQINSSNGSGSTFDVMTNARTAVAMSNNGTNWRPWCSAYSDNACGTQGGTYLGQGAHYQQFYNANVQPDCSAPINATNASANLPGQSAEDTFAIGDICGSVLGPGFCSVLGQGSDPIGKAIIGLTATVFNPIIQYIAGCLGIAGGGLLMILGIYSALSQTQMGQTGKALAGTALSAAGIVTGQPELMAASRGVRGIAAQRTQTIRGQQTGERQAGLINLRGATAQQTAAARTSGQIRVIQTRQAGQAVLQDAMTSRQRERIAASPATARVTVAQARLQQEQVRQQGLTTRQNLRNEAKKYSKNRRQPA